MFKVVCTDLKIAVKKNMVRLISPIIFMIFLGIFAISILGIKLESQEAQRGIILLVSKVCGFGIVYQIMKQIPLRISQGIFPCAAGPKEKMRYICMQFLIKFLFSIILTAAAAFWMAGDFFFCKTVAGTAVQVSLELFLLWNLNLRVGIGEKSQKELDDRGFEKFSTEEFMVNAVWFGILIIEAVIFICQILLTLFAGESQFLFGGAQMAAWGIAMLINLGFAVCSTPAILKKTFAYEKIYRQRGEAGGRSHEYTP